MRHLKQIIQEFTKIAAEGSSPKRGFARVQVDWWHKLTDEEQRSYLREHPGSHLRATNNREPLQERTLDRIQRRKKELEFADPKKHKRDMDSIHKKLMDHKREQLVKHFLPGVDKNELKFKGWEGFGGGPAKSHDENGNTYRFIYTDSAGNRHTLSSSPVQAYENTQMSPTDTSLENLSHSIASPAEVKKEIEEERANNEAIRDMNEDPNRIIKKIVSRAKKEKMDEEDRLHELEDFAANLGELWAYDYNLDPETQTVEIDAPDNDEFDETARIERKERAKFILDLAKALGLGEWSVKESSDNDDWEDLDH